ncbi:MAG: hypothetical protein R3B13_34625 [Polyangiaceae bacterium]
MRFVCCVGWLALLGAACGESGSAEAPAAGGRGGASGSGGAAGSADASAGTSGSAGNPSGGSAGTGGEQCQATIAAESVLDPKDAPLAVIGDPPATRGIFDPDLEYPVGAPDGAMSYSAVQSTHEISTRIAVSGDQGATWTYVAAANTSGPLTIPVAATSMRCSGGSCSGHWIHEVSSLIADPSDPDAGRRWKLFTHSYLVLPGDQLAYDLGHIALHVAPEAKGPWSTEGAALGWDGESPVSSDNVGTNVSKFNQLADCVALTEPSALYRNGGIIDLALGCATATGTIRIELLRSLDHAKSFLYSGTLVKAADAFCLGGANAQVNAAALFRNAGKSYVSVTVAGPNNFGFVGYRGCQVLELNAGGDSVARDAAGAPLVARKIDASDARFIGACDAAEGASTAGYFISMLQGDSLPPNFRIYTKKSPLP